VGYRADQQPDGTWTIYDVPVFATCVDARRVREKTDKPLVFDEKWLDSALTIAKTRMAEGYLPPMHVRHHEPGASADEVEPAGFFKLKRVGTMIYEGQSRPTLFADMTGVPDRVFRRIKDGALPYRSVEIHKSLRELDSLALLDHEVPFFRFELLRITDARPHAREGATVASMASDELAVTFAQGVTMLTFNDKGAPAPATEVSFTAADMAVSFAAAVEKAMGPIYAKLGIGNQAPAATPAQAPAAPPKTNPDRPVEVPAAAPVAVAMSATGVSPEVAERMAKLEGELTAMRASNEATSRETRVTARAQRLRAAGYGEAVVTSFTAKATKEGEGVAMAFADGIEAHRPLATPGPWSGELPRSAGAADDSAEVARFKDNPEKLAQARRFAAMHAELKRAGQTTRPLKDFLDANLADDLVSFRGQ
jgi:hypothetical protein